tara:strand:- start:28 stop:1383 length:1356 start_codon:yes stop_codon:yes gene_type:complete
MALTQVKTLGIADDAVTLAKQAGLARGKIIVGDANGNPSALAAGSDNQILTMDANGDVGWEAPAAGGISHDGSTANGVLTYKDADEATVEANLTFDGTTFTQTSSSDLHMKLTSGTSGYSRICLGDSGDDDIGEILYNNANNQLSIKTNATSHFEIQEDGDISLPVDGQKVLFGAGDDFQIYHDGTNNIIDAVNGEVQIKHGGEVLAKFLPDYGVELYYDNDLRFRTESAKTTHWKQQFWLGDSNMFQFRPATNQSSCYMEWWDDGMSVRQGWLGYGGSTEGTSPFYIEQELNGYMTFRTNNTEHFRIEANGDLKGTDTSIGSLSDSRLKKNIADFTYDLSKFKQFKTRTFDWINPELHGNKSGVRGFIAQELETIDSSLVGKSELDSGTKDQDGKDDSNPDLEIIKADDGTAFAKDAKLGTNDAMYVSVIQQLIAKIETLETKVAALEAG